jgi:hypothetical protein
MIEKTAQSKYDISAPTPITDTVLAVDANVSRPKGHRNLGKFGTLAFTVMLFEAACSSGSATAAPSATKTPDMKPSVPVPTQTATPRPIDSASASLNADASLSIGLELGEGQQIAKPIAVPTTVSSESIRAFFPGVTLDGKSTSVYNEGKWFIPQTKSTAEKADSANNISGNYVDVGPWRLVAFENIQNGAGHLDTHGEVGETIITADNGGLVEFAYSQLGPVQNDSLENAHGQTDSNWKLQLTFKGLEAGQTVIPVDPDTGKQLTWEDGSPIVFAASNLGDCSVELPKTDKNSDVRVGFVINMKASPAGVQKHEVKVEVGPNDQPNLVGENKFTNTKQLIKESVPEK